jgi:hypothetical protein
MVFVMRRTAKLKPNGFLDLFKCGEPIQHVQVFRGDKQPAAAMQSSLLDRRA